MAKKKRSKKARNAGAVEAALSVESVAADAPSWYGWASPLVIVAAVFAVYSNTFSVPFHFDDTPHIIENYMIKDFAYFWPPEGTRYVSFLSFAVNFSVGGFDPFGYHIFNTTVHAINGVLVWWFLTLTFSTPVIMRSDINRSAVVWAALLAGVVFAVHPMQTQAVTYVTQRFASMTTLFYLLAITLYIRARLGVVRGADGKRTAGLIAASFAAALVGMMTKEICFTLPFVAALYDLTFFDDMRVGRRVRYLWPLFLTTLIIPLNLFGPQLGIGGGGGGMSEKLRETQLRDLSTISRHDYLVTQFRVLIEYLRLLALPYGQSLYHNVGFYTSFFVPKIMASFAFLAALIGSSVWLLVGSRRSGAGWPLIGSFGVVWFFMTISVESSIIPINDVIFEHRVYLPSVGAAFVFSSLLFYGWERWRREAVSDGGRRFFMAAVVVVALPLAVAAHMRNEVWKDPVTLWEDAREKSPRLSVTHRGLGSAYEKVGRNDEAIREYKIALALDPISVEARYNLANVYRETERVEEAMKEYLETIRVAPEYIEARNNLAIAYATEDRLDEAEVQFKEAVRIKPDHVNSIYNLGTLYNNTGRHDEAIEKFKEAIAIDPYLTKIYVNLGNAYRKKGMIDEAIGAFEEALKLDPVMRQALNNLGNAYIVQERYGAAGSVFRRILEKRPDDSMAHNNLGSVYLKQSMILEAEREFREALRLNPTSENAVKNLAALIKTRGAGSSGERDDDKGSDAKVVFRLGNIHYRAGRYEEAMEEFRKSVALDPGFAKGYLHIGSVHRVKGDMEEAMRNFEKAALLDPELPEAHNNIGNIHLMEGSYEEAVRSYERAVAIRDDAVAVSNLGSAYVKLGRLDDAERQYKEAIEKDPAYVKARLNLAVVYERRGETDRAVGEYAAVLELKPGDESAIDGLMRHGAM